MTSEVEPRLTAQQRHAAVLEARGERAKEIARVVGVTPKTISMWRRLEHYKEEVSRFNAGTTGLADSVFGRVRIELGSAAIEALRTAVDALDATDKKGDPLWSVRLRAAEAILGKTGIEVIRPPDDAKSHAVAAAQIVVRVENGERVIENDVIDAVPSEGDG